MPLVAKTASVGHDAIFVGDMHKYHSPSFSLDSALVTERGGSGEEANLDEGKIRSGQGFKVPATFRPSVV